MIICIVITERGIKMKISKRETKNILKHFRFTKEQDEDLRKCSEILNTTQTETLIKALYLLKSQMLKEGDLYVETC